MCGWGVGGGGWEGGYGLASGRKFWREFALTRLGIGLWPGVYVLEATVGGCPILEGAVIYCGSGGGYLRRWATGYL